MLSWTVQSATSDRLEDVLTHYAKKDIVLLQGTRLKRDGTLPLTHYLLGPLIVYSAGYGPRSNPAAGVLIALHRRTFKPHHIQGISWPVDESLAGGAIFIRLRSNVFDYTAASVYVPINKAAPATTQLLRNYLTRTLSHLPSRTDLIMGIDGNHHIAHAPPHIGPHVHGECNDNGEHFTTMLKAFSLSAVNTHRRLRPTYYHGDGKSKTPPDAIVTTIRCHLRPDHQDIAVDIRVGDHLQCAKIN